MEFLKPESQFRVVCRPALSKDTPDVIELTSTIWEGHDYVPKVWDEWLMDPLGLLAVAEFGGRVVGLVKLTCEDAEEWWLEGLRVHPEYEGRRIASRLHDYLLDYWQRNCIGVLRLATASNRLQVQHLCERTGFRKVVPFIQSLACSADVAGALLLDCRRLVGTLGYTNLVWAAPLDLELQMILQRAGFQRDWELSLYIYEKGGAGGMV